MVGEERFDALVGELRTLGRSVPASEPSAQVRAGVMQRVAGLAPPHADGAWRWPWAREPRLTTAWRRRAAVVGTALLLSLLLAPPVRAAVAEWFGFAGVLVREEPAEPSAATAATAAPPPSALGSLTLDEARLLVAFTPVLPSALGAPDNVEVAADGRVLSMTWGEGEGVVRLDQFDSGLDFVFAKTAPGVDYVVVDGDMALWFDRPHEVVLLEADGTRRTETARLAGRTLIWDRSGTALRLEGNLSQERAVAIAESVVVPEPPAGSSP